MAELNEQERQAALLRGRLSKLSEASLRINGSLDLDDVLQGVLDSARALTDARYAVITTLDESMALDDIKVSGLTVDEAQLLWEIPEGLRFFEYLSAMPSPLRIADLEDHTRAIGLTGFCLPAPVSSFLAVPISHRGISVGNIHVAKERAGEEFSREDEETLVMFASQVALVIANARRYRDERRAKNGLETLIDTSPVGVVVFEMPNGVPLSFNREAIRIVDVLRDPHQPPEQLLEVIIVRRADGSEISLLEFPLAEVLIKAETVRAEEIVLEVPDGRSISVLLNATPIRSEEGLLESVVVTLQDLTSLAEVERLRAEFLAMVSHELRTPLTSIMGSAVAVLEDMEGIDTAELRQFLRIIMEQASSMRNLIGDLLDVARIETGTLPISPEPTEVGLLVDRARNTFVSGGGKNTLEIDLSPDLPLVLADRRRIVQVIGNLLSNAARHSPESSLIKMAAIQDDTHVEISVVDEGRGIPTEQLPHLFRTFSSQVDEVSGGGTGLGLSICKGIVEAHGGRVWADNEGPGLGARFAFTLPMVAETAIDQGLTALSPSRETESGQVILVVDDDPQTLGNLRRTLSGAGFQPVVTGDPEEALSLMEEHSPDLVLLDLVLPGIDGIDLMHDLFSIASVPVIFISAYGRDQVVARSLEAGASDYIVKPFSPTELIARVRVTLRKEQGTFRSPPLNPYVLGDLIIDYAERRVTLAGRPLELRAKEYQLLYELSVNAGRVVTHNELLRRIWGSNKPSDLRTLRTHLGRLRRKLGESADNPTYFFAQPRVGYRMAKGERRPVTG